jgi:hypothetical protein
MGKRQEAEGENCSMARFELPLDAGRSIHGSTSGVADLHARGFYGIAIYSEGPCILRTIHAGFNSSLRTVGVASIPATVF